MPTSIERISSDGKSELLHYVFPAEIVLVGECVIDGAEDRYFIIACDEHDSGADVYLCNEPEDPSLFEAGSDCSEFCVEENHITQLHNWDELTIKKTGADPTGAARLLIKHSVSMANN